MQTTNNWPTSLENDLLFKETLAHPDNRDKLIYFLACFTDFTEEYLKSVDLKVYYESILLKNKLKDKGLRSDILIKFDHYKIDLECYSRFYDISFNKSLTYIMGIYCKPSDHVIGINLIDNVNKNTFIANKLYSNLAFIYDKETILNCINLAFYRLDLARELPNNETNKKEVWLKFIGAKNYEERQKIAKGDDKLTELNEWIEKYVNDEKTNQLLREWDAKIARDTAIAEGKEMGQKEIIQNMFKHNFSMEDICKVTNLSVVEVNRLKEK